MNIDALAIVIVLITVLSVLWLNKQRIKWVQAVLNWFPAILFAYVIPAVFSHAASLDLSAVHLHSISRNWIIPVTIITVMSSLSAVQLKQVGLKPIFLFVAGSWIIATLPAILVVGFSWIDPKSYPLFIDQEYWKGLVPIVGGWIGGSTSQLVLKEVVQCPEGLFLSVLVLDNILVNLWTILMFQAIKKSEWLNKKWNIRGQQPERLAETTFTQSRSRAMALKAFILIAGLVMITNWFTTDFLIRVIILSVVGLLIGNGVPQWPHPLMLKIGGILIVIIMAILGLRLDFSGLSLPVSVVALCIVWLLAHYLFMILIARVLHIHMAWVPIASMANLGGISTAPAVTAAYNRAWMPHAILLAILSMVTGNFWGLYTIYLFGFF